jgi:cytochrome P450
MAVYQPYYAESPVFHHERLNAYFVLTYDDVKGILEDFETFSSHAYKAMPVRDELRDRIPEEWDRAGQVIQGGQAINMDPPVHTGQRKAMQRAFTPRRVEQTKPDIQAIANDLVDELESRGDCDLVSDYAMRLTLRVVGTMLSLPEEMMSGLHAWLADIFGILAPIELTAEDVTIPDGELAATYERIYGAYVRYSDLLAEREADPGEDLASAMLSLIEEDGGRALTRDQVLAHMVGITAAGTDTTAALITNMVRYFTEDPVQLENVLAEPERWDNAVREGLRRSGIVTQLFRKTTRETEIAGVTIPAGSNVCAGISAANGDPSRFPDPLRFDASRENAGEHLSLGYGRHYCLGAALAPPEARIALETLYARLPNLKADLDQELQFVPSITARVMLSQRVTWDAP